MINGFSASISRINTSKAKAIVVEERIIWIPVSGTRQQATQHHWDLHYQYNCFLCAARITVIPITVIRAAQKTLHKV